MKFDRPSCEFAAADQEALPEIVTLKNGGQLFPRLNIWQLKSGVETACLRFEAITDKVTPELFYNYKKTLVWFARNKSLETVTTVHRAFTAVCVSASEASLGCLTDLHVLNFVGDRQAPRTGWSVFKSFLKKWYEQKSPGISVDAYKVAQKVRADASANQRNQALTTLCPIDGPFTSVERDSFHKAYHDAFADGRLSEAEYILLTLECAFGARPAQLALLKVKDLVHVDNAGQPEYTLSIPSAKKKEKSRVKFKTRLLTKEVGKLIEAHCREVENRFSDCEISGPELPMFPLERIMPDHSWSEGFELHKTAAAMSSTISRVEQKIRCVSERTGKQMHINARRFRYTLGTVLAEEGHPPAVIAEAIDHEGLATVSCYTAVTGKLHKRLNKALALQLAPIAQAFEGVLVNRRHEAGGLHQIRDIRVDGTFEPVGNCGKFGFCKASAPLACYTCKNFRPFLDAPHEALLEFLLVERERLLARSGKTLAVIEDRTILAVAYIVEQCRKEQVHD